MCLLGSNYEHPDSDSTINSLKKLGHREETLVPEGSYRLADTRGSLG
jgi:hypothetical protein